MAFLSHHGVWDEVQKRVAEQASTGEAESDLEQRLTLLGVVQRDEEQEYERRHADGQRRHQGANPDIGSEINIDIRF